MWSQLNSEVSSVDKNLIKLLEESHSRTAAYNEILNETNLRKLGPANSQALMLQVEDFLDNNHIYSYKNWFEGTIDDGPFLEKFWVIIRLRYAYETMPDPQALPRLVNLGVKIKFEEITDETQKGETKSWIISLRIPKTLINVN